MGRAQSYVLPEGKSMEKVHFQLVNNLMVIPVELNGSQLSFILDSGVSNPILFNLSDKDSIQINKVSEVTINGLGDGEPIQALSSRENRLKVGKIANNNQSLYVVLDPSLNLSPSLGIPVHGIIGYDIFRNFVVDINYRSKTLKFYDPGSYKPKTGKKYETLPLSIERKKAYLEGKVSMKGEEEVPVKLLLDTGSSDAVWLFEDLANGLEVPDRNYEDFLGRGLSGSIYGRRTQIDQLTIGRFGLKNAKVAFPHMEAFAGLSGMGDRNGSLGGEVLKRFHMVMDYPHNRIVLSKNSNFDEKFHYNLSGIELQHRGVRYIAERIADSRGVVRNEESSYGNVQIMMEGHTRLSLVPEIVVSAIRAGSPAAEAGLKEGDMILAVNGKPVHHYKLQEIMQMLNEKEGKHIKIQIERYNQDMVLSFVLKKVF